MKESPLLAALGARAVKLDEAHFDQRVDRLADVRDTVVLPAEVVHADDSTDADFRAELRHVVDRLLGVLAVDVE